MSRPILALLAMLTVVGFPTPPVVVHAADEAQQIVEEAQRRSTTKSERYRGLLQSFDKNGKTSEKKWAFERLGSHGRSKTIIRFTEPAEVRGVALLIVSNGERPSDQWMWTPALERDRRIAMQDRSTRFFGTDFSFEDLEERDAAQYAHSLLGEETVGGGASWKIQAVPRPERASQYSRTIVWIRKDNYATVRIDSLVKQAVVRRLEYAGLQNIQGIWTARELRMADLKRGSTTRLLLQDIEYNIPLAEADFTVQALRRP